MPTQICNFFVPGLGVVRNLNRSRTTGNAPIDSYPLALKLYLEYWLDFGSPQWELQTTANSVHAANIDGDTGPIIIESAFNTLVLLLWRHKKTVLAPLVTLFTPIAEPKPYAQRGNAADEDEDPDTPFAEAGAKLLRDWLAGAAKDQRIAQKRFDPRYHRTIPQQVHDEAHAFDESQPDDTTLLPVLRALEYTPLNHLVAWTGTNNNRKHHQNFITFTQLEVEYFTNHFAHLVNIIPSLSHLLHALHDAITHFPLLENAPLWTNPKLKAGSIEAIVPDEYPQVLIRKDRDARQTEFDQAFDTFIARASSSKCLGLVAPQHAGASGIHLGMAPTIAALRDTAKTLIHHLAIVNSTEDLQHYPLLEEEWLEDEEGSTNGERNPGIKTCSLEALKTYYKDKEVQEFRENWDIYPDNEEIAEHAQDIHFGSLRSAKRKAPIVTGRDLSKRQCLSPKP